jgi:uncharacterized iron-regulated protein
MSRDTVVCVRLVIGFCSALVAAGCDGGDMSIGQATPAPDAGSSAVDAGGTPMATPDAGGLPARLPETGHTYRLMHGRGDDKGKDMAVGALLAALGTADVVCLGEEHDAPDAHAVQHLLFDQIATAAGTARKLAVGMEMFQVPYQQPLDDFSARKIDEATMLLQTQWKTRWGYDFGFYRPVVSRVIAAGGTVRALNAPDELIKQIDIFGLDGLSPLDKTMLPELDLSNAAHKAWFLATAAAIPQHAGVLVENLYAAQVVRDETMADTAFKWLSTQPAPRQLAILAGNGHCIDLAVPARIRRRGLTTSVLSVHPVPDTPDDVQATLEEGLSDVLVIYGL